VEGVLASVTKTEQEDVDSPKNATTARRLAIEWPTTAQKKADASNSALAAADRRNNRGHQRWGGKAPYNGKVDKGGGLLAMIKMDDLTKLPDFGYCDDICDNNIDEPNRGSSVQDATDNCEDIQTGRDDRVDGIEPGRDNVIPMMQLTFSKPEGTMVIPMMRLAFYYGSRSARVGEPQHGTAVLKYAP
jgi:hypothetical protein